MDRARRSRIQTSNHCIPSATAESESRDREQTQRLSPITRAYSTTMATVRRSAAALLLLLLLSAGRVADALLTPKARGLTLEEIFGMIQSEVEFE